MGCEGKHERLVSVERFSGNFTDAMMEDEAVIAALNKFCFDGRGYSVATENRMREAFSAAFGPALAALDKAMEADRG